MLTLQALTYIEGNDQTGRPIWAPMQVICAPMQVIKQPEHGRTSTTNEQK